MALELPGTDNADVERMAVAWGIVSKALGTYTTAHKSFDDVLREITEAYNGTYNAILANERQQPPPTIQVQYGHNTE